MNTPRPGTVGVILAPGSLDDTTQVVHDTARSLCMSNSMLAVGRLYVPAEALGDLEADVVACRRGWEQAQRIHAHALAFRAPALRSQGEQ